MKGGSVSHVILVSDGKPCYARVVTSHRRDGDGKTANLYAYSPHGTTPSNDGSISVAT